MQLPKVVYVNLVLYICKNLTSCTVVIFQPHQESYTPVIVTINLRCCRNRVVTLILRLCLHHARQPPQHRTDLPPLSAVATYFSSIVHLFNLTICFGASTVPRDLCLLNDPDDLWANAEGTPIEPNPTARSCHDTTAFRGSSIHLQTASRSVT